MSLNGDFYFDNRSLSSLKYQARAAGGQQETLKKVSQQFEAFFIKIMLKSMRDASVSSGEGLFDSQATQFYQQMFDDQLSVTMASRGSFGISNLLQQQLSTTPETEAKESKRLFSVPERGHFQAEKTAPQAQPITTRPMAEMAELKRPFSAESPAEFVASLRPYAVAAAKKIGIDANVLIAQAALETGWGQKIPKKASGQSSFNLFGIKADQRWQGERVVINTVEFKRDRFVTEKAAFRAYGSVKESIDDYIQFVKRQPRYKMALANSNDAERYLHELKKAGYATDPEYDHKIIRIMRGRFIAADSMQTKS
ncbi:MAG: flagellar assembly peptidoglycan hydrolase FlgJ [Gammaproteobacteria bacterium]|nr:flagellar assembly peptidoglycan hydrolase FlgJ [Gammaproteobacteria bacterium]